LAFVDGREDEIELTLAALADSLSGPRLRSAVLTLSGTLAKNASQPETAAVRFADAVSAHANLGAQLACASILQAGESSEELESLAKAVGEINSDLGAALVWGRAEGHLSKGERREATALLTGGREVSPDSLLLAECAARAATEKTSTSAEAWEALASVSASVSVPRWSSQALCRASRFAEDGDRDGYALELAENARQSCPSDLTAQSRFEALGGVRPADASAPPAASVAEAFRNALRLQASGDAVAAMSTVQPFLSSAEAQALQVFAIELAADAGDLDTLQGRYSAMASEAGSNEAAAGALRGSARVLAAMAANSPEDRRAMARAAEAWRLQEASETGGAIETSVLLAYASGDGSVVAECRAAAAERATQKESRIALGIRGALSLLSESPSEAADTLRGAMQSLESSRLSELFWCSALASERYGEAADCFEELARQQDAEPVARDQRLFRSAYLRVHHELGMDTAVESLASVETIRPGFRALQDLQSVARSHGAAVSSTPTLAPPTTPGGEAPAVASLSEDSIGTEIRRVEALARSGQESQAADGSVALRAQYPGDALAEHAFRRFCWRAGSSADLAEVALAQLRDAEESSDGEAKARACEELARIDLELRGDPDSARMFWESASKAAPLRADLQRTLEQQYRGRDDDREALRVVLGRVISGLEASPERSAYLVRRARLSLALDRDVASILSDYEGALEDDSLCREALFFLESRASAGEPSERLATLEANVAQYFSDNPRARAAFLVRSGETWRSLGQHEQCLARLKSALQVVPGFAPALSAWREVALDNQLWGELAEACLLEAVSLDSDSARCDLFLLAGVTLMDKVEDRMAAAGALRSVLVVEPLHREAFVRLRQLFSEGEIANDDNLAQLYSMRLEAGPKEESERCELHLALARVLGRRPDTSSDALVQYRALWALRPHDKEAVSAVADITWAQEKWADCAEALMALARIEEEPAALAHIFGRLGAIYAEHLPEPRWALKSFHKVVTLEPGNQEALRQIAALGPECGEFKLALGACEQLIKQEPPIPERIDVLICMSKILVEHTTDTKNAERALRHALDLDPGSDNALDALVGFYIGQNDQRSARVHIDRVANAMRNRIEDSILDAEAYRVLARAMAAKARAGATECLATAQVAASMAMQLGVDSAENASVAKQAQPGMGAGLGGETFDDLLFPHSVSGSAQAIFDLLGDRLAKHIGIDVRSHGVGRSDRLRKGIDPAASIILELAAEMGVDDVDIYVSKKNPNMLAVEPTSPYSLILGSELAKVDLLAELRFCVGRSLKGATASLAAPLQLGEERFGVLLVGLLRQFNPDFAPLNVDPEAASAEQQRLRRLIPSGMLSELQPYALGLVTAEFDHRAIWQAMSGACNRAGLACAGDGSAAIAALLRCKAHSSLKVGLQDPEIAALVRFACSAGHARLWSAMRA